MNLKLVTAFFIFLFSFAVYSQRDSISPPKTLSLLFGYGEFGALETYLSPYKYSGKDYRMLCEASRLRMHGTLFTQHKLNLNYAQLTNLSGRGLYHVGFLNYSYARNYQLSEVNKFNWFLGPALSADFGAIYNVRNDNNPVQIKASINLQLSNVNEYHFQFRNFPVKVRYELRIPVLGVGFAPDYGASYYEMFQLGNTSGIVHLLSLHNQWAMQNMLTLEIPAWNNRLRFGYYNHLYQTRINSLETSLSAHNFVIGFAGDFANIYSRKKGNR